MPAFDRLPFGPQRWLRALALSIVPLAPVAVGLNLSTTNDSGVVKLAGEAVIALA